MIPVKYTEIPSRGWSGVIIQPRWIPTRGATPSTALVPQEKAGFPIPNPRLLLGFQGTKTARREGISSPFSDAGGCTSCRNSGNIDRMARSQCRHGLQRPAWDQERGSEDNPEGFRSCWHRFRQLTASACRRRAEETFDTKTL